MAQRTGEHDVAATLHPSTTSTLSAVSELGDRTASALAGRATRHILDVLAGRRPLHQARQWLSGPVAGLIATMLRSTKATPNYRLRSVHACQTSARTVEACAVITDTRRARALTMRLERQSTQWSCTLLVFL